MAVIANYGNLKTEIANKLARTDLTADIPMFIQMAQLRMYREIRSRAFEQTFSSTISSGVIALPTGYLDLKYAYVDGSPVTVLERKDAEWINFKYPTRSSSGKPMFIAREASNFIFGPYPDSAYAIKGTYYGKLTAFSSDSDTNWFVVDAADATFFASLAEAARFLDDDQLAAKYDSQYEFIKRRIQVYEEAEEFSGSPLAVTVR